MGYTKVHSADFSARKKMTRISVCLVFLFVISTIPITTVSANTNIDMGFEETNSFQQGVSYPIEDTITLEIYAKNFDQSDAFNGLRWIDWSFCEGNMSVSGCDENDSIDNGTTYTANIAPNARKLISFGTFQAPNSGDYTLEVSYQENDINTINDEIYIVITVVDAFTDFQIDTSYEVLPDVENLNIYNGYTIYNSNKNYALTLNGSVENWQQNSPAQIGWQLLEGNVIFAEAMTNTANFPVDTEELTTLSVDLPFLNSPREGLFTLKYGLFDVGEDMNHLNNVHYSQIVFDNSLDVTINNPESLIDAEGEIWYAGLNSMKVVVENNGNVSTYNYNLKLEQIYDGSYTDIIQICGDIDLHPGESKTCFFDLLNPGLTNFTITIDETYQTYVDENPSDNNLLIPVEIIAGDLNASVILEREDGIFTFDDSIHLIAAVSSNAPTPLSFDWSRNGWSMATGEEVNLTARHMGTGTHQMTLTVTDSLNRVMFVDFELIIVNTTFFSYGGDMIYGVAPTRSAAYVDVNLELVPEKTTYSIDESLTPLFTLDVEAINSLNVGQDPGLERLDMTFDLDKLLPDEIKDNSSINMYWIENVTDSSPIQIDSNYLTLEQNTGLYHINTPTDGMFLIAAIVDSINLSITDLQAIPYKSGGMELTWNVIGNTENPLILDWEIYRKIGTEELLIPFGELNGTSPEDWELLTQNKLSDSFSIGAPMTLTDNEISQAVQCVDELDSNDPNYTSEVDECYKLEFNQRWYDPNPLNEDECASYVVVATNRQGETLWENGAVSGIDENGQSFSVCGDNKAPLIILSNLNQEVIYDNSTTCVEENLDYSRCYSVKLKWNWPMSISESVDFKLYRTEQYVTDLQFAIPLMTYENINPGTSIEYIDNGTNVLTTYTDGEFENIEIDIGIRPDRVYYYYLAPVDALGNERTVPVLGNWIEVNVEEVDVSTFHPEWIPKDECGVPNGDGSSCVDTMTGTDFERELLEYLDKSTFQIAGLITIIVLCLNFVLIPFSLQERKKAKRRIDHMIKTGAWGDFEDDEDY